MTDRTIHLTVVLDGRYRTDDVQPIVDAIRKIRGVSDVGINVEDPNNFAVAEQIKSALQQKLFEVLK